MSLGGRHILISYTLYIYRYIYRYRYIVINVFLGPKREFPWLLCDFCSLYLSLLKCFSWVGKGSKLHDIISRIKISILIWLDNQTSFSIWASDALGQACEPARLSLGWYGMWKIQTCSQTFMTMSLELPQDHICHQSKMLPMFSKNKANHE